MKVVNSKQKPEHLQELRELLLSEWKKVDAFEGNEFRSNPPLPLLALEGDLLIGGLSFTWYCPEGFSDIKLWINTVFVKPEYRGKGVASTLIKEAAAVAVKTKESKLFAFTEIPQLYLPLGWTQVSNNGKDYVLQTKLS